MPAGSVRDARSGVPGGVRQQQRIDMKLRERAPPLRVMVRIKQQRLVRWARQPGVRLNLLIQLPRAPAGIAECENAFPGAAALGDDLEDVQAGGQSKLL